MPWTAKFSKPIILKDGRRIETLKEVRELMLSLRNLRFGNPHWEAAADLLTRAADSPSATDEALAAILRALKAEGLL